MPASPVRLAANRAHAGDPLGASTSPRTPGGKAASSLNALAHGARAIDSWCATGWTLCTAP